ncbi:GGDEF domain-containing protein [Acinetobacter sp. WZC-1]|uniref:GGDEF domain-containing protein n=1 Tax=Acinetobacter sp. WZC-1 TaxID=3459034 RepID=UPI00403E0699
MRSGLHTEQISKRLFLFMSLIIISLLCISVPLIVSSYQQYVKTKQALIDIQSLRVFAETSNKISRERAPSNRAMSSPPETLPQRRQELAEYRQEVDQQIERTVKTLDRAGLHHLARAVNYQLKKDLRSARTVVDAYLAMPQAARTSAQMDRAILSLFNAWDSCRAIFKQLIVQSKSKNSEVTNYSILILILADLRDQAGRVASNIMAPVTFSEKMPRRNYAHSLQTQLQARYLWGLIDTIQPEKAKTTEYFRLHQRVKSEFLDQGIPIITRLMQESKDNQSYYLSGTQLTEAVVDKLVTVIDLQTYLLDFNIAEAKKKMHSAQRQFVITLFITGFSLLLALFTMIYTRRKIFSPLLQARTLILDLSDASGEALHDDPQRNRLNGEMASLFSAIHRLQRKLKQRDVLEFQLKNIANTDPLTGVSNRLALKEYLKILKHQPQKFLTMSLMVIDIDDFKQVNDHYGHIMGDQVITTIAGQLKTSVKASDLIVRFGGDEFLILSEDMLREEALQIAERIRMVVSETEICNEQSGRPIRVSVSIGVVVGAKNWMELLEKADQSLFRAKAKGKNAVAG